MNHRQDRRTRSRVHIFVGFTLTSLCILFGALTARGVEPPKKLVIADTSAYETALTAGLVPDATAPVSVTITDAVLSGYGAHFDLNPGDAAVKDTPLFEQAGIFLVPAPVIPGLNVESLISYDDGSNQNSFALGPIGAVTVGQSSTVGPLISDGKRRIWITTFQAHLTPVWVIVYDGMHGWVPKWESYSASPPVYQYRLETTSATSQLFLEVRIGDPWFGCLGYLDCAALSPLYGFASSGRPEGGNFKALPFGN